MRNQIIELLTEWHSELNGINASEASATGNLAEILSAMSNVYAESIEQLEEILENSGDNDCEDCDFENDDETALIIMRSEKVSIPDLDNRVDDYFSNVVGLSEYDKPRLFHGLFFWASDRGYSMDQLNQSVIRAEKEDAANRSLVLHNQVAMFVSLANTTKPKRAVQLFNDLYVWAKDGGYSTDEIDRAITEVEI